ncbi:Protein NETWORKED 4A like [Melia azedarach]|nr:Protein NETWORKED 4A like [Melia azedarach]
MDRSVKQMQKLIEDGESLSNMHRPELVAHIEDFYHLYQSLAERYDHLTGELQKNIPLDFQLYGSGNCKSGSQLLTPDHKLGVHKSGGQAASSTSGGSSDFSLKETTELSSSSSSDSESESFNSSVNVRLDAPINIDGKGFDEKIEENVDGLLEVGENGSYEELLGKVTKYEEKLRVSNLRLQLSEEEIARLKSKLNYQIESARSDIKMREADLEMERRQVFELQNNISQLKLAQEEVAMLSAKLDSEKRQVLKLQERIARYESDLSDRDDEIGELKLALIDTQEKFSLEKAYLQYDMSSLLEKQTLSDVRLKELELQGKVVEDKIKQCETENMEMKDLHMAQESGMQAEINHLKVEVAERCDHIETLNKNLDGLKYKYDMLMAEKDEVNAKVNTLMAEASSRNNHIEQVEEHLQKLHTEHAELIAESETARKLVDELRLRVKELEKEVDQQRMVILDGAEEKREAIRQLCFSLEHYRTGYKELRQAFLGFKRPAVMAA